MTGKKISLGDLWNGERKIRIPFGIYLAVCRMCDWNWKCLEISLCGRPGRWRSLCALLPDFLGYFGIAYYEYGIFRRPGQPEKSGKGLPGSGKAGTKMAYSWRFYLSWLLSSYDVLHYSLRLDALLLLPDSHRPACGLGFRCYSRKVYRDAGQSDSYDVLDACGGSNRYFRMYDGPPKWPGASYQGYDDCSFAYYGNSSC